jgi:hypothetical protein
MRRCLCSAPLLQRGVGAGECGVQGRGGHVQEYTKYTSRWKL